MDRFQIGVHFLALAAAFALAVPIGWDREKRARSAGLRTFPLVAMASCGFVQASESLLVHSPDGMAKVIEGLITGIGFIGGGAILKQGTTVQGTATAASLWATGAIGVSVGLGSYDVAVTVAVFTFLTLRLLTLVKEEDDMKDEGESKSKTQERRQVGLSQGSIVPEESRSMVKRDQSVAASICDSCDLPTCGEPKSGVSFSDRDRRRRLCSHRQTIC